MKLRIHINEENPSALRMQISQNFCEEMQIVKGLSLARFAFLRENLARFAF